MHARFLSALLALGLAGTAQAQEAMYTQAATMPSPGITIVRPQFFIAEYGFNPVDNSSSTRQYKFNTSVQTGLARGLSLSLDVVPGLERSVDAATGVAKNDKGVDDIDLMLKWRFFKEDSGGIDTLRMAFMGGARVPSGDDRDFSTGNVNPHAGVVVTMVRGRHGFNQDLIYSVNTGSEGDGFDNTGGGQGPADALRFNTAYLYRIIPDAFRADSRGAWYVTAELNGIYETNGDIELRWSPGLMYEGYEYAFEVMAQFPIYNDVNQRAELDFEVGIGFRFTF